MKLLIVDDEELTRSGLLAAMPWKMLGITEIYQADDGISGVAEALRVRPEIILCDVRMPRMDGIRMAERIQEILPETSVIFMSGYSDKEYLKAAIKLKVISYVEKPLNLDEIKEAVREAVDSYQQKRLTRHSQKLQYIGNAARLAALLTFPYEHSKAQILELCGLLGLSEPDSTIFTAFLMRLPDMEQMNVSNLVLSFSFKLGTFLHSYQMAPLAVDRHQNHIVCFIYGNSRPSFLSLQEIRAFIQTQLSGIGQFVLCHGQSVTGIRLAYESYETSVLLMQSSFFFGRNQILIPDIITCSPPSEAANRFLSGDYTGEFREILDSGDQQAGIKLLEKIYQFFDQNMTVLPDQAKDLYYRLFTALKDARRKTKLPADSLSEPDADTMISYLAQFSTYEELHQALVEKVGLFFKQLTIHSAENTTIYLIKEYIHHNYRDESLTVRDISSYVHMNTSYVCTLFKSETGQTLNQYITEYRMEKAKKLLLDPRYKIAEISARVGYSDGNYFGKSFRRVTGLSPSEYREMMMK